MDSLSPATDLSSRFALDTQGVNALKRSARENPQQALKGATQQFEALFLNMVLKSMREASPGGGMGDSQQLKMYQSLLDQQLSQNLAKRGATGLAAMMEKQLAQQLPQADGAEGKAGATITPSRFDLNTLRNAAVQVLAGAGNTGAAAVDASAATGEAAPAAQAPATGREFFDKLWAHARSAGRATGVPPRFLIAQAALETGWGKNEIRMPDGSPSHNLFNIKAGKNWTGPVVEATTTEYVNGVAQKQVERFRAYGSYAEGFADYARLVTGNARYSGVVGETDPGAFARGLQDAGYATDPRYAEKLERIISGSLPKAMG